MHLQAYEEYSETYDRFTVEECRCIVAKNKLDLQMRTVFSRGAKTNALKRISKASMNLEIYRVMGERYREKEESIRRLMQEDARRDEAEKNAKEPQSVICKQCNTQMLCDSRFLEVVDFAFYKDVQQEEMHFLFTCPQACTPHLTLREDGSEVKLVPFTCTRCGAVVIIHDVDRAEGKAVYDKICTKCDFIEHVEFETYFAQWEKDIHFAKDRAKYCMSHEKGQQYIRDQTLLDTVLEIGVQ